MFGWELLLWRYPIERFPGVIADLSNLEKEGIVIFRWMQTEPVCVISLREWIALSASLAPIQEKMLLGQPLIFPLLLLTTTDIFDLILDWWFSTSFWDSYVPAQNRSTFSHIEIFESYKIEKVSSFLVGENVMETDKRRCETYFSRPQAEVHADNHTEN